MHILCRLTRAAFFIKNLSAPCDKTGFLPLVFPLWGRLQRGKARCGRPFSAACSLANYIASAVKVMQGLTSSRIGSARPRPRGQLCPGRNFGIEIVSLQSSKVTSTGNPIITSSGAHPTIFVIICGPSSRVTSATTYGTSLAGETGRRTIVNDSIFARPLAMTQSTCLPKHFAQQMRGKN